MGLDGAVFAQSLSNIRASEDFGEGIFCWPPGPQTLHCILGAVDMAVSLPSMGWSSTGVPVFSPSQILGFSLVPGPVMNMVFKGFEKDDNVIQVNQHCFKFIVS